MPLADAAVQAIHDDVRRPGMFVPVSRDDAEERAWLDCDLASLAENQVGDLTHPHEIDDRRRAEWRSRGIGGDEWPFHARREFEQCYWIIDRGQQVGTAALANSSLGSTLLRLSSFYIFPDRRNLGLGVKALTTLEQILARHGAGIRLETSWCWQRAVRFYLNRGMWVRMWKHDLVFCWDASMPVPSIEVGADTATLSIEHEDKTVVMARAQRHGDTLDLDPPPERNASLYEAQCCAEGTLSVAIALHSWPLVRSARHWEENHWADSGPPESLAYKIIVWEAWNRKQGWRVDTPRIAGLHYPTWDELEAGWKASSET